MQYYRFKQNASLEQPAWMQSRTDFFEFSDPDGTSWLYLPLESTEEAERLNAITPSFTTFEAVELNDYVDWGVQWSNHSPDFKDYCLQVDLAKYTKLPLKYPTLYLNAGPGFGDLSHPTTRLMLALMAPHMKGKKVLDIGCGSGILSLAALFLGAEFAWGIDIEVEALAHAMENARLNNLEEKVSFMQPEEFMSTPPEDVIILMNMIRSQQQVAWGSLPQIHNLPTICITSGVLATERFIYLAECKERGWKLLDEQVQGDWMAFYFEMGPKIHQGGTEISGEPKRTA